MVLCLTPADSMDMAVLLLPVIFTASSKENNLNSCNLPRYFDIIISFKIFAKL
jgi:hypothetical protein